MTARTLLHTIKNYLCNDCGSMLSKTDPSWYAYDYYYRITSQVDIKLPPSDSLGILLCYMCFVHTRYQLVKQRVNRTHLL